MLLIHRDTYDDWSFPKGKAKPGEDDRSCAVREIREETGLECVALDDVGEVRYIDRRGRPKCVCYFVMRVAAERTGGATASEVDEMRWVSVDAVADTVTRVEDSTFFADLVASGRTELIADSTGDESEL